MVDPNTRQGKRTPVTLKIKFKSETLEQFIERYAVDVSQGGIFIRTKEPLAVGTQMRFEFQLRDASPLIAGEGTVVWTRENDPSRPAIAPGMGVRFDRLAEGSQQILERILSEKAKQAPARPATEATKPPMFTDTPTRVAPLPVQEALLGNENRSSARMRSDSFSDQGTPLPRPMPFHSDADDFDEQAFEEATKVRALDELIAQTADLGTSPAADSSPRRPSATAQPPLRPETATSVDVPKAPIDRDSAPTLPSPPEPSRPQPRLLDTTPSPRAASPAPAAIAAATPAPKPESPAIVIPPAGEGAKTRLGMEPAPVRPATRPSAPPPVAKDAVTKPTGMRAAASEPSAKLPATKPGSAAPMIILLLLLVAAGGAAVWFFVLREKVEESVATTRPADAAATTTGSGSDVAINTGSGSSTEVPSNGSAGSAAATNGSAVTPTGELVATVVAASAEKATVEILGTDQTGPAPLTAKLEKDKPYKARVQAPGFAMLELDLKGGDARTVAKLVAKPRKISVTSEPPGAVIFVDNASTGKATPFTIELTKVQAAKKSVRIGLRRAGYKPLERIVDTAKYTEDAAEMTATLSESLSVQIQINTNTNTNTTRPPTGSGSGSATVTNGSGSAGTTSGSGTTAGSGSATTPTGSGSGSAVKPPTGTGSGSATAPTGSGSATTPTPTPTLKDGLKPPGTTPTPTPTPSSTLKDGPKEPEPDFMKKP